MGGEPRVKFMVNSEAVDLMQNQGANNVQDVARPLQSSESAAISDASLQEAIDTLSGEIESLEKQLDGGDNERYMVQQRDQNDGNIVVDASSNRQQQQQHSLAGHERDQRHMLSVEPLSTTTTESSSSDPGNGYYDGHTPTLANRLGRTPLVGRDDGGQVSPDDSNENYGTMGPFHLTTNIIIWRLSSKGTKNL